MTATRSDTAEASREPAPGCVEVQIFGALAILTGAPLDLIYSKLTYTEKRIVRGEGHYREEPFTRQLFVIGDDGRVQVPAGAMPRLERLLAAQGYDVTVRDHRRNPPRCNRVNVGLAQELGPQELELTSAIQRNMLGQVFVQSHPQGLRTIELIARSWPESYVMLPVATNAQVARLCDDLSDRLRGQVTTAYGRGWARRSRVTVATWTAFEHAYGDLVDVIVFPDAEQLVMSAAARAIADFPAQRRYAIVEVSAPVSRRMSLVCEAVCGPMVYRWPHLRGEKDEVTVFFVQVPKSRRNEKVDPLERKRALWNDERRNTVIAALARAMADGRNGGNRQAQIIMPLGLDATPSCLSQRVAVLVEVPEHGRRLQACLGDWPLLTRASRPPALGEARDGCPAGLPLRSIMTHRFAAEHRRLDVDVLIDATGLGQPPHLPHFPLRRPAGRNRPVVVVDVVDPADAATLGLRLEAYRARGWQVIEPANEDAI